MTPPTSKVVILGCTQGGLAAIRSLGRRNIPIIAVAESDVDFGIYSKYVTERVLCPSPTDPQAFVEWLLSRGDEWAGALILETADVFSVALAMHKEALQAVYTLITPDLDITQTFIEKDKSYQLAEAAGVPYPTLIHPQTIEELDAAISSLTFPVMIKPILSHEFVKIFNKKLFIADDADELRQRFAETQAAQLDVVIQEIIMGKDETSLESLSVYIDRNGVVRGEVFNIKLRQIPSMWGVMRVGQSVMPIDDIRNYSHQLLRAANFRGFADLEFKRDMRDGLPKLIEVNIRLPQNLQMLIASGVDFPWLIYQDVMMGQAESSIVYQPTYYIDAIHDFFYSVRREPQKILNAPKFFKPYLSRNKTFPVLAMDDMKPFAYALKAKLKL